MEVVAGVDFGTLSVRVSLVDRELGLLDSALAEYPLHRQRSDPEYATQSHEDHIARSRGAADVRQPLSRDLYVAFGEPGGGPFSHVLPELIHVAEAASEAAAPANTD